MLTPAANQIVKWTAVIRRRIGTFVRGRLAARLDLSARHWRCCSIHDCGEVNLSSEFLPRAKALRIEARIPWGCPWPELMPRLSVVVLDEDAQILIPGLAMIQTCNGGTLLATVMLDMSSLRIGRLFQLRVESGDSGHVLATIVFRRLDRETLLKEIEPAIFELRAHLRGRTVVTTRLHDRLDNVDCRIELKLASSEHQSIYDTVPLQARLVLSNENQTELAAWETRLRFASQSYLWTVEIPRSGVGPSADCRLKLFLGDRELAVCPFTVRPYKEAYATALSQACEGARLVSERYLATDHRGRSGPMGVVAEDFQAIAAELVLHLGQPDPLFDEFLVPVRCVLHSGAGDEMAAEAKADARFGPGNNPLRFLFSLRPEMFKSASQRCTVEVSLRQTVLARFDFIHKPRRQIITERRQAILNSLDISGLELAVTRDGEPVLTDVAFVTDESLSPRFQIRANGFDEDVPEVVWPLVVRLTHLTTQHVIERQLNLRTRAGGNLYRRIKLAMPEKEASRLPGEYSLTLHHEHRVLAESRFRVLAEQEIGAYCRDQVIRNLRVVRSEFLVKCADQFYSSTEVPCVSQQIDLRVVLTSEGFCSALTQLGVSAELRLRSDAIEPVTVKTVETTLSPEPARFSLSLEVIDTFLAKAPGSYILELFVAGRNLASHPFRLLSTTELCESVTVEPLTVTAADRVSNRRSSVDNINPESHESIHIAFATRPGMTRHPLAAPSRIEIAADGRVLFLSRFETPLDSTVPMTQLRAISVSSLWRKVGKADQQLTVRVRVGNSIRASREVRIGRRQRVTTVEGALTMAPEQMPNVEAEYAAILANLGVGHARGVEN